MADSIQGRPLWYQLNTSDSEKGIEFYRSLIGWDIEVYAPEGRMVYPMFKRGQMPLAGVYGVPADGSEGPPAWLFYIGADDVDATYEKAMAAGAQSFVPPSDIPDIGRFAILADPWGATFAIYKPGSQPPPEGPVEIGEFSWHEISADDLEKSWSFYQSLFGWEAQGEHDMGPEMGPYRLFGYEGRMVGGIYKRNKEMPVNAWSVYVMVDDVAKKAEAVEKAGGKVVMPVMEVPGGDHIVGITDPQGAYFSMHQKAAGNPEDCPAKD